MSPVIAKDKSLYFLLFVSTFSQKCSILGSFQSSLLLCKDFPQFRASYQGVPAVGQGQGGGGGVGGGGEEEGEGKKKNWKGKRNDTEMRRGRGRGSEKGE